jgi:hypothetical protein
VRKAQFGDEKKLFISCCDLRISDTKTMAAVEIEATAM